MTTPKTPVILVGRHSSQLPADIEVVAQENILWATNRAECRRQFLRLLTTAHGQNAAVLLQNVPAILAVVIADLSHDDGLWAVQVGVIISVPDSHDTGKIADELFYDIEYARAAERLIRFANARAKIEIVPPPAAPIVRVTVDPVPEFVFDHIEWF